MSLIILTKSPVFKILSIETIKNLLKILFNKKRGPQAVTQSLIRGLKEIDYDYKFNPHIKDIKNDDVIFINESLDALSWAINYKKSHLVIAGPNLVITPNEADNILCNKKIDFILEPSEWTKNFILSIKPELKNKLYVWPAGVHVPENTYSKKNKILLYIKNNKDYFLIEKIKNKLTKVNMRFEILNYAHFDQKKYFKNLEESKGLIYISKTESQGLAIQEAWARNVPTMVLENKVFQYKEINFKDQKLSAPYLNEQIGIFFTEENFEEKFDNFIEQLSGFIPRKYVTENLSDKICVEKFLGIINEKK